MRVGPRQRFWHLNLLEDFQFSSPPHCRMSMLSEWDGSMAGMAATSERQASTAWVPVTGIKGVWHQALF
jgi:hypothetical protein